nr:acyl-CoA thioesterase domain-containing protein [Frankia canadensis]
MLALLDVVPLEADVFRAPTVAPPGLARLFGGEVAARALGAAQRTVPTGFAVHSLHGYFLREGAPGRPVLFRVDRVRDGRSFLTRQVTVTQDERAIFTMTASFHRGEDGADVARPFPAGVVPPRRAVHHPGPTDDYPGRAPLEIVELMPFAGGGQGVQRRVWMRSRTPLSDDPAAHARALTYASDLNTAFVVTRAAGLDPAHTMVASLSHTLWLHRPVRFDDWALFEMSCESAAGGRGLVSGTIHGRDGTHVASLAQEVLARPRSGH